MRYNSVTFTRVFSKTGLNKIPAIKGVRAFTKFGLKESKELVEDLENGPRTINLNNDIPDGDVTQAHQIIFDSGVSAHLTIGNNETRINIGKQIESTATWATISGQYDLAKECIVLLEKYFPSGFEEKDT